MRQSILLVEDDRALLTALRDSLETEYTVNTARSVRKARSLLEQEYLCIVLDLSLADGSGLDLCREIRASGSEVPVLVLTVFQDEASKVELLEAGADGYLTKPAGIAEIKAYIRALSRRHRMSSARGNVLSVAGVTLDTVNFRLEREGQEIVLRPIEFTILERLMRHAGHTVRRHQLVESVWGERGDDVEVRSLAAHVCNLRQRFDDPFSCKMIRTIPAVGYRFEVPESRMLARKEPSR